MPRASNGTYTLPAGNPVVSGTTITVSWGNTTLSDIATALTGSLARNGDGGMTAPLLLPNGTSALPAMSFTLDPDTGFYIDSPGDLRLSVNGVEIFSAVSTVLNIYRPISLPNGSLASPSINFTADANTGFLSNGNGQIGISLDGVTGGVITQGSFTPTWTGFSVAPVGDISWQRIGNEVFIKFPNSNGTSNGTDMTITNWPAAIRPANLQVLTLYGTENSVVRLLAMSIQNSATVQFFVATVSGSQITASGTFTASGSKGPGAGHVNYSLS